LGADADATARTSRRVGLDGDGEQQRFAAVGKARDHLVESREERRVVFDPARRAAEPGRDRREADVLEGGPRRVRAMALGEAVHSAARTSGVWRDRPWWDRYSAGPPRRSCVPRFVSHR